MSALEAAMREYTIDFVLGLPFSPFHAAHGALLDFSFAVREIAHSTWSNLPAI